MNGWPQANFYHPALCFPLWCPETGRTRRARGSPFGGRLHLLIRLVSHDVVNDFEAAAGPGTGTQ